MIRFTMACFALSFLVLYVVCPPVRRDSQPRELKRFEFSEVHMGTTFRIVLYAPDQRVATKAAKAAFARIAQLDNTMSDYKKTSELMRLCQKAGGPPARVSDDLLTVLSRAQMLAKKTKGAFDVSVGPVVRLWRKARRTRRLPDAERLKKALAKVGWEKIRLDAKRRTVQLIAEGMLLDLGGIAKGFAADAALAVLRRFGITRAMVVAGGDIAVGDAPPERRGWKVGIGRLKDPTAKPKYFLSLKNSAVSTSGDVEQFVKINGMRYSHIVNPRTGLGLIGRSSVTVIAKDATTTDSMATAVSVLGPKKGMKLIESTKDAAALIVRENREGRLETLKSRRFDRYVFPGVKRD